MLNDVMDSDVRNPITGPANGLFTIGNCILNKVSTPTARINNPIKTRRAVGAKLASISTPKGTPTIPATDIGPTNFICKCLRVRTTMIPTRTPISPLTITTPS